MSKKNWLFKHYLVPKHRVLSKKEAMKIAKKYGGRKFFPKISSDDPVVKLLGAKPGDIIEITRKGEGKYYRVVVR